MTHAVLCGDLAHEHDPDDQWVVEGFRTAEAAREFARRFVRDQIEGLRVEYADAQALKGAYLTFGEYADTPGFDLHEWVDFCVTTPASRRSDTDYQALDPSP